MLRQVEGGGNMTLRSHDPTYLMYVDRWFKVLMPKVAPYLYTRGGPIIMIQVQLACPRKNHMIDITKCQPCVLAACLSLTGAMEEERTTFEGQSALQVENEFGFIGPDYEYMEHLHDLFRATLGDNDTILYTTDPPDKAAQGGYPGHELLTYGPF